MSISRTESSTELDSQRSPNIFVHFVHATVLSKTDYSYFSILHFVGILLDRSTNGTMNFKSAVQENFKKVIEHYQSGHHSWKAYDVVLPETIRDASEAEKMC